MGSLDKDQNQSSGEKAEPAKTTPADSGAAASDGLPIVEAPKLAGGEAAPEPAAAAAADSPKANPRKALPALLREPVNAEASEPAAASGPQAGSFRFALLAATIACAAGVGALIGSLTATGIGHPAPARSAIPKTADARDVVQALKAQLAELSALKASLDSANRSTGAQFAKIADRLNNIERTQADPAAKLAHIADAVDRLDKKVAASPDITGSIAAARPASAPAAKIAAPVLHDWVVQDVRNGRAMVESRYGAFFLVGSGSVVPGLGRVQDVKRQDGEWVVVTEKGLITSRP